MAKEVSCESCIDLQYNYPELVVNGFTDDMCASMGNDTGLKASVGHNDCTDLKNLNDCLIGNMATELDKFDVCDWKAFMEDYITNDATVNEAMICAICGIWRQIHAIWDCLNS